MCEIRGNWDINWDSFRVFGVGNLYDLTHTKAHALLGGAEENDICAFFDDNYLPTTPYLRLYPFGTPEDEATLNTLTKDGDILIYLYPKMPATEPFLKQRGMHAEICFKDVQGICHQAAPWRDHPGTLDVPHDRSINTMERNFIAHLFRPDIIGLTEEQQDQLKHHVAFWRKVYNKYVFPPGATWYLDPADFHDVEDLKAIAFRLLNRTLEDPTNEQDVTCVQWSYTILCLALCFPITNEVMTDLGLTPEWKSYWSAKLNLTNEPSLKLPELPFVPLSPAQVLQDYLNVFADGQSVQSVFETNAPLRDAMLEYVGNLIINNDQIKGQLEQKGITDIQPYVHNYIQQLKSTGDMTAALKISGMLPMKFILPISFYCKSRLSPAPTDIVRWKYIGTLIHHDYLRPKQ